MKRPPLQNDFQRLQHKKADSAPRASVLGNLLMILFAIYFLFPILWLMFAMTKSTSQLFSTSIFRPGDSLVYNVKWLAGYEDGIFLRWVMNSILYASVTASLSVLVTTLGGYALSKYKFALRRFMLVLNMAAMMIPQAATVIPLFLMIKKIGLLDSYAGVVLPMLAYPFGVYFMSIYIRDAMPSELIDSGRIDGAGDLTIFFRIALPLLKPGLVTLFLIAFINTWNNFFLPLVLLNDTKLYPVTLGLKFWVNNLQTASVGVPLYPLILIGAFISIFPMMILFIALKRYITSGIAMGSVKG